MKPENTQSFCNLENIVHKTKLILTKIIYRFVLLLAFSLLCLKLLVTDRSRIGLFSVPNYKSFDKQEVNKIIVILTQAFSRKYNRLHINLLPTWIILPVLYRYLLPPRCYINGTKCIRTKSYRDLCLQCIHNF